jgi:hypothetical protein
LQETEPPDSSDFSEFARGILSGIPDEDRPVVAKYIKEWDGNVTRKFQEIHQQYQPYMELGDIEDIQYARYYASMMQNDPAELIRTLTNAMKEAGMPVDNLFEPPQEQEPEQQGYQIPPQYLSKVDQLEKALGTVYSQQQTFQQQQIEAQQMAQLDKLMSDMHSQHGDFDDDWFLLQLEKGKTPDQAINAYKERFGSPERKPAPRILTGNGAVRQDQVDPSKLSDKDRKAYALAILQANSQT